MSKSSTSGCDNALNCINHWKAKAKHNWIATYRGYNADSVFPVYLNFIIYKIGIVYSYEIFVINKYMVQKEPNPEADSLYSLNKLQKQIPVVIVFIFLLGVTSCLVYLMNE